jgi:hypothetical protein
MKDARNGWCRVEKRECRHVSADPEVNGSVEHDENGQVVKQAEILYRKENEFCNDANRPLDVIIEEELGCPLLNPYDYLTKEQRAEMAERMRKERGKQKKRRKKRGRPKKRKKKVDPKKQKKKPPKKRSPATKKRKKKKVIRKRA